MARLEVQERVEQSAMTVHRAAGRTDVVVPPDAVFRRMLAECTTTAVARLTGLSDAAITECRQRMGILRPWVGYTKGFLEAAARVTSRRWAMWSQTPPDDLSPEDLVQLILADEARVKGQATNRSPPAPPLTPPEVLVQIRRFREAHSRWPTAAEMAVHLNRQESSVKEKVARLVQQGLLEREGHTLRPVEIMSLNGEVRTLDWTPEQLAVHLASLGLAPHGHRPLRRPPSAPVVPIEPEEDDPVVKAPRSSAWPPTDGDLLREADEIKRTGSWLVPTLSNRYGVASAEVNAALSAAKGRLGQTIPPQAEVTLAPVTAPAQPELKVTTEPAPAPAAPKANRPTGRHVVAWPSDRQLNAEVEEIRARGESVTEVLCRKYGTKDGPLWTRIGDARERLGLPRKVGGPGKGVIHPRPKLPGNDVLWALFAQGMTVKEVAAKYDVSAPAVRRYYQEWVDAGSPGAAQPATAATLTEYLCTECNDTGFIGGSNPGEFCDCAEGRRRWQQAQAASAETSQPDPEPISPTLPIAEAVQDPPEGNPPTEESEPSTSPTERSEQPYREMTDDILTANRVLITDLHLQVSRLSTENAETQRTLQQFRNTIDHQKMTIAALEVARDMAERHAQTSPVLLLWDGNQMRQATVSDEDVPNVGDEYAEPTMIEGRRRYVIWVCRVSAMIDGIRPLRILHLVLDTTAVAQEAA